MAFHPYTRDIWATEMGRDMLGDGTPPDELNIIKKGGNYGWPICYGKNIHDTEFDKNTYFRNPCMEPFETPSYIDIPAHSVPLGLAFIPDSWPTEYHNDLLVAYHGSWNRSTPTGRGQNVETWMHAVLLDFLLEGAEEESLTRACWRVADAAYGALHDQDVTAVSGVTTRGAIVQVMAIGYGPMIARAPEGRPFRKDVFLSLDINHKDQLTPIG